MATDFAQIVTSSERVSWTTDALIGESRPDLAKRFLPETLACVGGLSCLETREQHVLNQIRGHSYCYLFYFIEESILAGVKAQLMDTRPGDGDRLRALLRFADEEVKHQQMFRRFCDLYRKASGVECGLLASRATAEDVAATVMKNTALSILLVILHIEWVSQRHYVEAIHGADEELDPLFVRLLKAHWLEEAQHTKIDVLLIRSIVDRLQPAEIEGAIDDYLELGKAIDGLLYQQMELDVATLETAIGRQLSTTDRETVLLSQATACRRALLWLGMTNPPFVEFLDELTSTGAAKVAHAAAQLMPS